MNDRQIEVIDRVLWDWETGWDGTNTVQDWDSDHLIDLAYIYGQGLTDDEFAEVGQDLLYLARYPRSVLRDLIQTYGLGLTSDERFEVEDELLYLVRRPPPRRQP